MTTHRYECDTCKAVVSLPQPPAAGSACPMWANGKPCTGTLRPTRKAVVS